MNTKPTVTLNQCLALLDLLWQTGSPGSSRSQQISRNLPTISVHLVPVEQSPLLHWKWLKHRSHFVEGFRRHQLPSVAVPHTNSLDNPQWNPWRHRGSFPCHFQQCRSNWFIDLCRTPNCSLWHSCISVSAARKVQIMVVAMSSWKILVFKYVRRLWLEPQSTGWFVWHSTNFSIFETCNWTRMWKKSWKRPNRFAEKSRNVNLEYMNICYKTTRNNRHAICLLQNVSHKISRQSYIASLQVTGWRWSTHRRLATQGVLCQHG